MAGEGQFDPLDRAAEIEAAARNVVEKQDAFLAAPEGASTLHRSHLLSLAIERLRGALNGCCDRRASTADDLTTVPDA